MRLLVRMDDGWMMVGFDSTICEVREEASYEQNFWPALEAYTKVRLLPMYNLLQGLLLTLIIGSAGQSIFEAI